jgi:hypothetical protein
MKLLITLLATIALAGNVYAESKEKEVCKNKKDQAGNVVKDKDGKPVQTCKKIKVHKKLEGTKVPDQKK